MQAAVSFKSRRMKICSQKWVILGTLNRVSLCLEFKIGSIKVLPITFFEPRIGAMELPSFSKLSRCHNLSFHNSRSFSVFLKSKKVSALSYISIKPGNTQSINIVELMFPRLWKYDHCNVTLLLRRASSGC